MHNIESNCHDERCGMCYTELNIKVPATHKIGEETNDNFRHNLTRYVCCAHFHIIMGPGAENICTLKRGESIPL